jgi:hypothetical protein
VSVALMYYTKVLASYIRSCLAFPPPLAGSREFGDLTIKRNTKNDETFHFRCNR